MSASASSPHDETGRIGQRGGSVPDAVDDALHGPTGDRMPWVEPLLRTGWVAKGVVYLLMGMTAFSLARHGSARHGSEGDQASPEGALGQLAARPGGVPLLAVTGGGLVLYALWRTLSAALVRGGDGEAWARRVGYLLSAIFYAVIGAAAVVAAVHGDRPRDSGTIERASRWALGVSAGRWMLLLGGAIIVVVGVSFVIDRGVRRAFLDDLRFDDVLPGERAAVVWLGTLGWIGRGIVTVLVGGFVARAAWTARSETARGFDGALRDVAASSLGSWLVGVTAIGLVLYGAFCVVAVRHLELEGLTVVAVVMVVLVAVLTAAVLVFEFELRRRRGAPLDTERAERWFVRHAPRPLARVLRAADRRVAGGAATAAVFVVLFVASLAVGWIFDGIDDRGGIARWDRSAAVWGAEHATDSSVRILDGLTQLGATGWLLGAMVVVGVVESRRHRRWAELGYLLLVGAGVSLLNSGLKLLVGRERPDIARLASFGGSSFPSGHAAAAAACWAAIAFVVVRRARRRRARALAAATAATITAAVATSRVLLGVHWLSDVVAGVVTGWAWFVLVTLLFGGRILRFGEPAERIGRTRGEPSPDDAAAVGPV